MSSKKLEKNQKMTSLKIERDRAMRHEYGDVKALGEFAQSISHQHRIDRPRMIIIQCVRGCGKSHMAYLLCQFLGRSNCKIVSMDDFMLDKETQLHYWDSSKTSECEEECLSLAQQGLEENKTIIVDNCNFTRKEVTPYIRLLNKEEIFYVTNFKTWSADQAWFVMARRSFHFTYSDKVIAQYNSIESLIHRRGKMFTFDENCK
jgi:hypothetical protein